MVCETLHSSSNNKNNNNNNHQLDFQIWQKLIYPSTAADLHGLPVWGSGLLEARCNLPYFNLYLFLWQSHPELRFCPGPNCNVIVRATVPAAKRVICNKCDTSFWYVLPSYCYSYFQFDFPYLIHWFCLQCFDAVGWVARRAFSL